MSTDSDQTIPNEVDESLPEFDEASYPAAPVRIFEMQQGALAAGDDGVIRPIRHIVNAQSGEVMDRETLKPIEPPSASLKNNPESLDPYTGELLAERERRKLDLTKTADFKKDNDGLIVQKIGTEE